MTLRTARLACLAALVSFAAAGSATAADSPLAIVPATAPVVIQVRGLDQTKNLLIATLSAAAPNEGPLLGVFLNNAVDNLPEGRKLQGLAKEGPVFITFTSIPTSGELDAAGLALVAKVTDFNAFRDGLLTKDEKSTLKKEGDLERYGVKDRTYYFVKQGDYAII